MNYSGKFDAKVFADGLGLHSSGPIHAETVHATHAPAGAIVVPDAQLLFNGEFKRSGVDLILSKDDRELVLHDYFKGEKRAALSSPDGAHLTGDLVNALAGHVQYAQADGNPSVSHVIGHVSKLTGTATAIRNGVSIILNNGDNVEKGDVVQSGSNSTLGITFIDGTVFGLSSNARMVLNEMVYDPNGSNNSSLLSLVAGTATFVAGETAKHGDMKVDTPVATMGIRGTAVLFAVHFKLPNGVPVPDDQDPPPDARPEGEFQVVIEPDGTTGKYILFDKTTLTPFVIVDTPGLQINITSGNVTQSPSQLSPEMQKLIDDVFSLKFTDNSNTKTTVVQNDSIVPVDGRLGFHLPDGTISFQVFAFNDKSSSDNTPNIAPTIFFLPLQVTLDHSTAKEGAAIHATGSGITGFAWQVSTDNGLSWTTVGTNATYTPTENDEGKLLQLVVKNASQSDTFSLGTVAEDSAEKASISLAGLTSGHAVEGTLLTATVTDLDAPASSQITYTWNVGGTTMASGKGLNAYTPTEADEGKAITVNVSFTDIHGNVESGSVSAGTVAEMSHEALIVTINGSPVEGKQIAASVTDPNAVGGDVPASGVTYTWYADGKQVFQAIDSNKYTPTEVDEGKTLTVTASFTDAAGNIESATSAATATVTDDTASVSTPTIAGSAIEGHTLTASATANDADATVTYQWFSSADGYTTAIGSGASYVVKEGDESFTLKAVATATDTTGGTLVSATSAATATVTDDTATLAKPIITGSAIEGHTLTASATANDPDATVTYQWFSSADGYTTAIGSGASYVVKEGDESFTLKAVATATDTTGGTLVSATSAATATVTDDTASVSTPTIAGSAIEGHTLTASATANDPDATVTYQWFSSADGYTTAIGSGASYVVKEGDESFTLKAVATATDTTGGTLVSATSAATATVTDATATLAKPIITGSAIEGHTLTASATANDPDATVTYQWFSSADGYTTAIGSGASYVVKEGDESFTLKAVATATDTTGGTLVSATSAATATVTDDTASVSTPTIAGSAIEGHTLTASATANDPDATVTYQWFSSADGYTTAIGSGASYVVKEGDESFTLKAVATATDTTGGTLVSATSAATATVTDDTASVSTPTIAGSAIEGHTLTASATANDPDATVTYQWFSSADGYTTAIGSGASYVVKEGDESFTLKAVATATDTTGGTLVSATSAATATVTDATASVSTPTIAGSAIEGHTLTASATANDADATVTYQWFRSGSTTVIGTGASYTVQEGDESHTLHVVATATDTTGGTLVSATSAATATVTDDTASVSTPTIAGSAIEGHTLTASATANDADATVTYQWFSSADGYTTAIGSGASYIVKEGDESHTLHVVATATDTTGGTLVSATSAATATVTDDTASVSTPTIAGSAIEGHTLTASATANDLDATVTYQWFRSGSTTVIGTGASYTVQEGDESHTLHVVATATDTTGGTLVSATSAATATVTDATASVSTPTIAGSAIEGHTLTASATANDPDATVTYQWFRLGSTTVIGTGASYTVQEGDESHTLHVVATATDTTGGTLVSATSAATATVTDATASVSTPIITGSAIEGHTLTASATANDLDATVTYQWFRLGSTTVIGTGASYTVQEGDESHTLKAVATATDTTGGTLVSATSAATATVTDATATLAKPIITGSAIEGHTLTASATANDPDATVTYQWFSSVDGYTRAIGSGSSYLLKETDEFNTLKVVATATDTTGGTLVSATSNATSTIADNNDSNPAGVAGSEVNLGLAATAPPDPGSLVTVTVADLPSGWSLKGGVQVADHIWTVQSSDLQSLAVTTSSASLGAVVLQVSESWINPDGTIGSALIADNVESYAVGSPIFALAANDYLTGSGGSDEFVFAQPIGHDVIYSFDVASDKIDLVGFAGFSSFSDITAHLSDDGAGNTVLTLGPDQTVTLHGVSAASLSASDFEFDQQTVLINSADIIIGDGAKLPLSGMIENTGLIELNSTGEETNLQLIQSGATLHGSGQIVLSDSDANIISGTSSSVTLNNQDNTISGAGQLGNGELSLINSGTIDATGTHALVIDTGANMVLNSGLLEASGSGGMTVVSSIANSGILWAHGANLTVEGAVSGDGIAKIDGGGTLDFESSSTASVVFAGPGELILQDPTHFSGIISDSGGSMTPTDLIDVAGFDTGALVSYSGTTSGGIVTISEAGHTTVKLQVGANSTSWSAPVADGNGGILIHDPPVDSGQALAGVIMQDPGPAASSTIVASAPNQTLTGFAASDNFVFNFAGVGHTTVTDFHPDSDTLQFKSPIFASALAAFNAALDDGHGNTVIAIDAQDTITLNGVHKAQLHASDFHVV